MCIRDRYRSEYVQSSLCKRRYLIVSYNTMMKLIKGFSNYFIQNTDFFTQYFSVILDMERMGNFDTETKLYLTSPLSCDIFYFPQKVFFFTLRDYRLANVSFTKSVFSLFKFRLQEAIKETPDVGKLNSYCTPYTRCFSCFLNRFVYLNIEESKEFPSFQQLLLGQFEMAEEEFDLFICGILKKVWNKSLFNLELKKLCKLMCITHVTHAPVYDIALIQNLILLLPEDRVDFEELLQLKELDGAENKGLRDYKMQMLCCMLFNVDFRLCCYLLRSCEVLRLAEPARVEYLVRKELVKILFRDEKFLSIYKQIDIQVFLKAFPDYFRKAEFDKFLESFLVPAEEHKYTIGDESLKYYDCASNLDHSMAIISELDVKEIAAKFPGFLMLHIGRRIKGSKQNETIDMLKGYFEKQKDKPENLDTVKTVFLKTALEITKSSSNNLMIKEEFLKIVEEPTITNELFLSTKQMLLQKPALEEAKATSSEVDKAKEHLEEQKAKIKGEFAAKMSAFAEKHGNELASSSAETPPQGTEEICSVCKEKLGDKKSFGRLSSFLRNRHCFKLMLKASKACGKGTDYIVPLPPINDCLHVFFNSCGHYVHTSCYLTYNNRMTCPVCKRFVNGIQTADLSYYKCESTDMIMYLFGWVNTRDETTEIAVHSYICKSAYVGVCLDIRKFMSKQLEDMKYFYCKKEVNNEFSACISQVKPHLSNLLNKCKAGNSEEMERLVAEEIKDAIGWVLFRRVFAETKSIGTTMSTVESIANSMDVIEDAAHVLVEVSMLLSIIENWSKEKVNKFLNIAEIKILQEKLTQLQVLLIPSIGCNILEEALKKLLINEGLPVKGTVKPIKELEEAFLDPIFNPIMFTILGTVKEKLSLIKSLPEDCSQFLLTYMPRRCSMCYRQWKEKALCLACGVVICFNEKAHYKELVEHKESCEYEATVYIHICYGFAFSIVEGKPPVFCGCPYKLPNGKSIADYVALRKTFFSQEISKYKLSKKSYDDINVKYLTNGTAVIHNS
eukprot:TRINITY_DN16611_c0_g1_i1.p1 TRINITY_DN16611_c0_g1~~TRINITY_DN16611_c0_g1_i1.p1  ORF type:complete len:1013 (-),score=177.06 TRINITY_DN16611_c0_g1_i1:133-3171(-)